MPDLGSRLVTPNPSATTRISGNLWLKTLTCIWLILKYAFRTLLKEPGFNEKNKNAEKIV